MSGEPAREYQRRLELRRQDHDVLNRTDARLSAARMATFGVALLLAVLGWRGTASYWWCLVPVAAFAMLAVRHDRVIRARDRAARSLAFYERGLARIEDRWQGTGEPGDRFLDDRHLYANDLDLFGRGSLFELLSLARTRAGEDTLARWLKQSAPIDEVHARQDAVRELTPMIDLREALSQAGADVRAGVNTDALLTWGEDERRLDPPWLRLMAMALTAITVSTAGVMATTGATVPLGAALIVQLIFATALIRRTHYVLESADWQARDLDVLAHVLARLERERFTTPRLAGLRRQLDTDGLAASRAIRSLHRLLELHDWQRNAVFGPIGAFLLWGTHIAFAIDMWRRRHGGHVRDWLSAIGELETFASLAAYRFEHPGDPFPELLASSTAIFDGVGLAHPLIPAAQAVRNDVGLVEPTRLLVVSGSNMSGKSTMLRTIGVNAVLAQAGAPVRATALRMSPLAIGATLRIQDSLQEGRSRFYAEITRIRELSDAASGKPPLLFLLDELFHGTNSHDRLAGAAGVLGELLRRGAVGLVTTHDMALTVVVETLGKAINVHFDDRFDGTDMKFDYRMKPGPVTRSNALALMRAVGLNVGGR